MNRQQGYTLVEMSIVLVIIGLVVGGVFVGKALIQVGQIRKQISQFQEYDQAVQAFRLRYNSLPGDTRNHAAFGFLYRTGVAGSGDGNGIIQMWGYTARPSDGRQGGELTFFWSDLARSGMIADPITITDLPVYNVCPYPTSTVDDALKCFPKCRISGNAWCLMRIYTVDATAKTYYYIAGQNPTYGCCEYSFGNAQMSPSQLSSIDQKMDDGLPLSGSVTVSANGFSMGTLAGAGAAACASTATTYNANPTYSDQMLCVPSIRTGF